MESLTETLWDVTISGTGLAQSLLALALSRSGKKVLHVDKNKYYGGSEAAFSLQEAQEWVDLVNAESSQMPFEDAQVYIPSDSTETGVGSLSPSRAYTLALSPQLIYSRSQLLPTLVSSKVYRQLEFQAVGSWWVHAHAGGSRDTDADALRGLYRVPSSREDVFADEMITTKSKRTLMRFLRHIGKAQQEDQGPSDAEEEDLSMSFPEYLTSRFQVPEELHEPLLSLSLSQDAPQQTPASFAIPRVKRHLASIGVFGAGFGSLLAKWGGGSEISQVGCRALAVGGGVYVLNTGVQAISKVADLAHLAVELSNGETVTSRHVVGSHWDLPSPSTPDCQKVARSITIVASPLDHLFPVTAEGSPIPSGAVVVFPGSALGQEGDPPVYLLAHSSETGECPLGQSVIYGSVAIPGPRGHTLLESAVEKLVHPARILWSLRYTQLGRASAVDDAAQAVQSSGFAENVFCFPPPSLDLAFDDGLIDLVRAVWRGVMGDEARDEEFLNFDDREEQLVDA
ncbi:hypothetical protein ASPZODRAFT_124350 [Penicilliopsis zonata CBS 506.65]|uniref:Rab proteins geranylgeranyltransferase n=1 Tax=Penicilliopsis zonata CBS 506.65 TaxID=1073090 RepID=A0A1L9S7N2_9EURO|nr:hypothetical protein ASPZODRAFT_124350 [Penicilliopsis zonata CBS 506.65]OJJ43134.1 hypothetical protein ASPZODRAFT_124350 [Penicilliopsis zonata CBS 506.65]